jgi:RNA polymerase-binding transcription factor DksA
MEHLSKEQIKVFKNRLREELTKVESELLRVGRRNPSNPDDWEPVQGEQNVLESDRNEVADKMEAYEENSAILKQLEIRYNNIKLAISKIEEGVYGICEISDEPIELDRLEANPAARTCKTHLDALEEKEI